MFSELFDDISKVRVKQFPRATMQQSLDKAIEECQEAKTAPRSKRPEEFADAIICIFNAAAIDGVSAPELYNALTYKGLVVNPKRKFILRSDGLYQHVKDE